MKKKLPLLDRIHRLPAWERKALHRRALDPNSAIKTPPFKLVTDKHKYGYIQKRNKAGSHESFNGPPEVLTALAQLRRIALIKAVWTTATLLIFAFGTYHFQKPVAPSPTMAAETRRNSTPDVEHLKARWQKIEAHSGSVVQEMVMAYLADDQRLHLEQVFYAMLRFSGGKLSISNFQRAAQKIEVVGDFAGWLAALDQSAWMRPVAFRDNWGATSTSAGLSELFKTSLRSVTFENGHLTMRGLGLGSAARKILSETGKEIPTDWHVEYAQDVVEIFESKTP